MTKTTRLLVLFCLFCIPPLYTADASGQSSTLRQYLKQVDSYIKAHRHFEAAETLKQATQLAGKKHPSLHMRLAILYYGLGLISEAIEEGEKAVQQAPSAKWYKYDLAKFYYVDKQYDKSQRQFTDLLQIDPGFTLGYYYLAELYYQTKQYDMAWLSYQRAKKLGMGQRGIHLEKKLNNFTAKPQETFPTTDHNALFRFIRTPSKKTADNILKKIAGGKLFENLELELNKKSAIDFGMITLDELKDSVAQSLRNRRPYDSPSIVQTGSDFRIIQRIMPFDTQKWQKIIRRGKTQATQPAIRLSRQLDIFYAVETWKNNWQNGKVEDYFSSYSSRFKPEGDLPLHIWEKTRREKMRRTSDMRITISDPQIEMINHGRVIITFLQTCQSPINYNAVVKALTMDREERGWKIIKEHIILRITPENLLTPLHTDL